MNLYSQMMYEFIGLNSYSQKADIYEFVCGNHTNL